MAPKKTINIEDFIREAQKGTSPARLSVRFGIAVSSARRLAQDNGFKLPTIKEMRRKNGLPGSTKWEPPSR